MDPYVVKGHREAGVCQPGLQWMKSRKKTHGMLPSNECSGQFQFRCLSGEFLVKIKL